MWTLSAFLYFFGIFGLVHGSIRSWDIHADLIDLPSMEIEKKERFHLEKPMEQWIQQKLDHFDTENNRTWTMRYYENGEFFNETGPIFILLGGELVISEESIESGFFYEISRIYGAMMYMTEHRYYGRSHPVEDTADENLVYLNTEQVLADIAHFIETKKNELKIASRSVIVFGGSYSGNLAAWMRITYPHLVLGALASSAPVYVKAAVPELYEAVTDSLREYDEKCSIATKEAFSIVEGLLRGSMKDLLKLQKDLDLCFRPDFPLDSESTFVMTSLARIFFDAAQFARNGSSIADLCHTMSRNETNGSPYKNLARVLHKNSIQSCVNFKYLHVIYALRETSWRARDVQRRIWLYQSCTSYGYWPTSTSSESIFGTLIPASFYIKLCNFVFNYRYNVSTLNDNIRKINLTYNSKLPQVKNVIFTNGDLDPWKTLSVLSDLNTDSPSILINGSSHAELLSSQKSTDCDNLKNARRRVISIVSKWLNST